MLLNKLHSSLPDTNIKENWPLSSLTTLGTGGTAEFFVSPSSPEELCEILQAFKGCPVHVLGGGSNVLIPDGLTPGLVISTRKMNSISWLGIRTAEIGAGYSLPVLLKEVCSHGLGGLEFAAGIPGTLGGAVCGNAGAGGLGVCELVDSVKAVDPSGSVRTLGRDEFSYGYRRCSLSGMGLVIVSVIMTFRDARHGDEEEYSRFMLKRENQPLNARSAGCTFKNPEGYSAGKLLDECGCKGLSVGGAVVSDKHANFILNTGNASSSDVLELARLCAQKVHELAGVVLEPEIRTLQPCFFLS